MKYYHHRDTQQVKGGLTFAFDEDNGRVFYAVAKCSKRDNFCKRIGRAVATGRFDKGLDTGQIASFTKVGNNVIEQLLAHYADN